jgi:hypothetical protein
MSSHEVRLQILTVANMKISIFWDIAPKMLLLVDSQAPAFDGLQIIKKYL